MKTDNLLFEIGTEELPTKAVKNLSKAFTEIFSNELIKQKLSFQDITSFATPRRIAVLVKELQTKQEDYSFERKGPSLKAAFDKDNNFTKAAIGFAKSCGTTPDKLDKLEDNNGSYLVFKQDVIGQDACELLPEIIKHSLKQLPIPKPMRWSNHDYAFVRPVHWVLLLLGKNIVTTNIFGVETGNTTYGHRFHSSNAITINKADDYEQALYKNNVIANFDSRLNEIKNQVNKLAETNKCKAIMPESLLEEVTSLVEWPEALLGQFSEKYLEVPQECLITSMVVNQKYFALTDKKDQLKPNFVFISNIKSKNSNQVVNGNERVLSARLADAEFFFNKDKSTRLEERMPELAKVTYQHKLGSLLDKTSRVEKLALVIAKNLNEQNISINTKDLARAAILAKTDLTTEMVYEFTELQGIMGKYYAKADNESDLVANSIEQHYWPKFAGDKLPESLEACILSIAEKLDTIVGIFTIGQKPTGEKDPFGLRRAALGVLRILIEKKLNLDLKALITNSLDIYAEQNNKLNLDDNKQIEINNSCLEFCFDRLKKYYLDKKITVNLYYSVINTNTTTPYDFDRRITAVNNFLSLPQAEQLIAANKRVKNILSKQKTNNLPSSIDNSVLNEPAEIVLNTSINQEKTSLEPLYKQKDYNNILTSLAKLQSPIDDFFDNVMVMTDNEQQKNNRLLLLKNVQSLFNNVADISELQ